ncbi:hypothetical protein V8C35DRAFT_310130 [Trichoderma chlorosporum]
MIDSNHSGNPACRRNNPFRKLRSIAMFERGGLRRSELFINKESHLPFRKKILPEAVYVVHISWPPGVPFSEATKTENTDRSDGGASGSSHLYEARTRPGTAGTGMGLRAFCSNRIIGMFSLQLSLWCMLFVSAKYLFTIVNDSNTDKTHVSSHLLFISSRVHPICNPSHWIRNNLLKWQRWAELTQTRRAKTETCIINTRTADIAQTSGEQYPPRQSVD